MNVIKYIIIIIGIIFSLLGIVFGAYLPFQKARLYITSVYQLSSLKTQKDFESVFDKLFNYYSPIGDEEVARYTGDSLINAVASPRNPESISRYLINYLEPKMKRNEVRHLISLAQMYFFLWKKSGNEEDFLKAEEYYLKALEIGPRLPLVLYGLWDLYREKGDKEKLKQTSETILKYWPEDERIKEVIKSL